MIKSITTFLLFTLTISASFGQKMEVISNPSPIVCHASHINEGTRFLNPEHLRRQSSQKTANIVVTYNGFTPEAQAAFQYAVDIWEGVISSPVTIYINANWTPLDQGVLGSAGAGGYYRGFEGAKKADTWYPVALAEKMAGRDLNAPGAPDINSNFSSTFNWYLGTDGNTSGNQYDLVTVVLHEIGHGLGFAGSFRFADDVGTFGSGTIYPFMYDHFVENQDGDLLISLGSGTTALGNAIRSNQVFFDSPYATEQNGSRPKLYAPATWSGGSSMSHLDENTYSAGNPNSLMSPQVGANEVMHSPGPITLNMFGDMGWEYNYTMHTPLTNTDLIETDSFTVVAIVTSDAGLAANSVKLHYAETEDFENEVVVSMIATGQSNEYAAKIPSKKLDGQEYFYYITNEDIKGRSFSKPSGLLENFYSFKIASDNVNPIISHTPPPFIKNTDTQLSLNISVSDFLPLKEVKVVYSVNGVVSDSSLAVKNSFIDSLFVASIDLTGLNLQIGDVFTYSISATDNSIVGNSSTLPTNGNFTINVIGLLPTQSSYANNFDSESNDFFENDDFSIATIDGFTNGAIHSIHPYANGPTGTFVNYIYELKVPILLRDTEAFMNFDEVVLVEPSEEDAVFGDDDFWDYVIIEGSVDGGVTWKHFIDGYDSRANSDWLEAYNGNISGQNSTTVGNSSLYKSRTIDLLANGSFSPGQEVQIRFRMYADEAAFGWGWAIDNLRIQTDEIGPKITHSFIDYVNNNSNDFEILAKVKDAYGVDSVVIITQLNDQSLITKSFLPSIDSLYSTTIALSDLGNGGVAKYQIQAFDINGNASYLPSKNEFFEIPLFVFNDPTNSISENFDQNSDILIGNFFEEQLVEGFTSRAVHSKHNYLQGFGPNGSSDFTYTLRTPIIIADRRPEITFDEIAIVEPATGNASFGQEAFNDYMIVEGSKDNGLTWKAFENGYNAKATGRAKWLTAFNNNAPGNETMYISRTIDMTASGDFTEGDVVIIRFRMHSNSAVSAWGWAMDNLEIQTNSELGLANGLSSSNAVVYPNPNNSGLLNISIGNKEVLNSLSINVIGLDGSLILTNTINNIEPNANKSIQLDNVPNGVYIVQLISEHGSENHKVILLR